jgi:molecular chaperone GrpE
VTNSEKQAQDDAAHAEDAVNGAADVQSTLDENAAPASSSAPKGESVTLEAYQTLQAQAQQYLDGWQRERAEFANYQRRSERDLKASYQNATGDAFKAVLPILDDFERAMSNVPAELGANTWVNGVGMILRKFYTVFENNNVTIVDPTGQPFNPVHHEAIGTEDNPEVESGMITATLQKGYLYGDRVLRPALVRVAR